MALSMRRIFSVIAVAALMAVMVIATEAPAFADPRGVTPEQSLVFDNITSAGGSREANGAFHQLVNPKSDLIVVNDIQNIHGSGDPFVENCNTRGQDGTICRAN